MNALRSEWIKLVSLLANKVMWLVALLFPTVVILLIAALANDSADSRELTEMISGFAMVSVMVLAVMAVIAITGEYAHGTVRPTFAAQPGRVVSLVAKLAVLLAVAVVTMLVVLAVSWFGFTLLADEPFGGGWPFWEVNGFSLESPAVFIGVLVVTVGMVLFGVGAGMLVRNVGGAVALVLLWPLVAEGLLVLLFQSVFKIDDAQRFMPTTQGFTLLAWSRDVGTSRIFAGTYFLAWMVFVYVIGVLRTSRSDA